MSHVALIVNPFASAVDEHRIALVERVLARLGSVSTHLTERRGHATELALSVAGDVDAIFVFSGDGGFNEVANGLGPDAPPVGCIPGGGTSVFPRGLGLPRNPVSAAERLVAAFEEGRTRRITLGRVNGRRFLFNAGLFVIAPARVRRRTIPGLLRYVLTGRGRPKSVLALHDVDRVDVRSERPLALQADGEDLGDVTESVFEAEREALSILT